MSKFRLQFDFSGEALEQLDKLKDSAGVSTRAELVRQALRLLQWTLTETQDKGATILLEKDGKLREVIFPFMTSAKAENGRFSEEDLVGQA